jgi:hypothetical protein
MPIPNSRLETVKQSGKKSIAEARGGRNKDRDEAVPNSLSSHGSADL